MFFDISRQAKQNFSCFWPLGEFVVSTDAGWKQYQNDRYVCVYKGYADSAKLFDVLDQVATQTEPTLFGNFCVIVYDRQQQQLRIQTDKWRSFPIYIENHVRVTNLIPLPTVAWSDSTVTIHKNFSVTENKFDVIGKISTQPISLEQAIDQIDHILNEKTKNFVSINTLPVRVFLSGGVDTLLVYSYLKKFTDQFELVKCNIIEYDRFWLQNSGDLSRHWAYAQIHHWINPCVLTSGAPGDEFMLRSPTTADLWLKYHGTGIDQLLKQKTWLHSDYFDQPKHLKLFENQVVDDKISREQFYWNLCNNVVNDWQHWHLGNTLTWTPLRDLDIFKLFLRLPIEATIEQIMNSAVSLQLIEKNSPGLCSVISDQKNSGNAMKNLCGLLLDQP